MKHGRRRFGASVSVIDNLLKLFIERKFTWRRVRVERIKVDNHMNILMHEHEVLLAVLLTLRSRAFSIINRVARASASFAWPVVPVLVAFGTDSRA